jgi:phosphatidylserine/phosphatidylglycerophosphate/cardiolipin synthase-like enzyme
LLLAACIGILIYRVYFPAESISRFRYRMRTGGFLGILLTLMAFDALAQSVVINELYNSSASGEWAELIVLHDSLDMRGWSLQDFSSGGLPQSPLTFTAASLWSNLSKGTVIVIGDAAFTGTVDTDPSDGTLMVKSSDAALFSGSVFSFAGTSDAIHVRDAASSHVFGISWGSANTPSLDAPKIHFSSTLNSSRVIAFQGDSVTELIDAASWQFGGTTPTPGTGNSAANLAWISSLHATADGSGTASIAPDTLVHGQTATLQIGYTPDTTYVVTALRVIIPAAFIWSHSASDVSLNNLTATVSVSGDTITASTITVAGESCSIGVHNVHAPDSTGFYSVLLQSRAVLQFRNVPPTPTIVVFGVPTSIAEVKGNDANGIALRAGQLVTLRGVVTVANQFGVTSYVQDNTAGIAVYGSSEFSNGVSLGDEVVVSGLVQPFAGLCEIVSPVLHAIASTGNTVEPLVVTASDIENDGIGGVEQYEGRLIRLNGATIVGSGTWSAGTGYTVIDATGSSQVYINSSSSLIGGAIPASTCDIVGVVGQHIISSPYIGGYEILPRFRSDIISSGPVIATVPVEGDITPTSVTISWTTERPGTAAVRYGKTTGYELGSVAADTTSKTSHVVMVTGLTPATVYHVQAFSVSGGDTSRASDLIVSTASSPPATGIVNVYFNKSVRPSVVTTPAATGDADLVALVTNRINNARRSVDAALYSLSGTVGANLASALVAAKSRGVHVRIVCEAENRDRAPLNSLNSAGIPVITDAYDAVNAGAGLMHNKFMVIDGRGGAAESIWVWTGSWNPTDDGTNLDYQNAIEIQDPALAGAYTLEFNEMWGSDTDSPNAAASRFGARKSDNTPHRFNIGGQDVECYFSPSDKTTSHIIAMIAGAVHTIDLAQMTITRDDIADVLVSRKTAGAKIRGVVDNNTDAGSDYVYLLGQGVDLHLKTGSGLLHHKYAILDAGWTSAGPTVITGSHNWSSSAENLNNENTLILHDPAIADLYLQEFAARYYQFGGTDTLAVSVGKDQNGIPLTFALQQNHPNPFNPKTVVSCQWPVASRVRLVVYDMLGREVATLLDAERAAGRYEVTFDATGLSSGVYVYRLTAGEYVMSHTMLLLR